MTIENFYVSFGLQKCCRERPNMIVVLPPGSQHGCLGLVGSFWRMQPQLWWRRDHENQTLRHSQVWPYVIPGAEGSSWSLKWSFMTIFSPQTDSPALQLWILWHADKRSRTRPHHQPSTTMFAVWSQAFVLKGRAVSPQTVQKLVSSFRWTQFHLFVWKQHKMLDKCEKHEHPTQALQSHTITLPPTCSIVWYVLDMFGFSADEKVSFCLLIGRFCSWGGVMTGAVTKLSLGAWP